jgi:large subunit ribosomal protein L15
VLIVKKKRRKISRQRGSGSHGWGHKKKHRGKGSRGGKGYGGAKAKYIYITAKEPEHYGHRGFYSLRKKGSSINLDDLNKLAKDKKEIDLSKMGIEKLLGHGEVTAPLVVIVSKFSASAKEKIEKAGGKIVTDFEESE